MVSYRSVALNTLMVIEHGNWTSPMEVYSWELGTSSLNIGLPIATFDYRRVHVFTLLAYFWVGNRCLPFVGHWTSVVSIIPLGQIPTTTQQHLRNIQFAKLVVVFGCLRKKHPHICFFFGWEILLSEKRGFDSLTSQCPLWTAGLTLFMDRWYRGSIVQFNRKNNHVCMNIDVVNHICSFLKSQSKCAPHFQTHPFMGSGLIWSRHHVVTSLECVWETIPKW